jgi:secreted Zn-dependent insulinase-like peptidase
MKDMDATAFAEHQQAILTQLLEKDKRLSERTRRYNNSLALKYLDFNHREELAATIRATTIKEVSDYYQQLLLSEQQRRIIIESTGNKHRKDAATNKGMLAQEFNMKSINAFRTAQDDYSL